MGRKCGCRDATRSGTRWRQGQREPTRGPLPRVQLLWSHFAFLGLLGNSEIGKHKLKCSIGYKKHSRLYNSPCWPVGLSVHLSHFVSKSVTLCFFSFFRLLIGREAHIKVFDEL